MNISNDVVSRCKSAPERSTFAAHPYCYSLSTSEVPKSQPEKEITTSSRTRSRATGQGTIDQYFIKKKEEMKVSQLRGTDISSSLSANKNVSQRSRRSRPDPPIGTTSSSITSSICNTSTNEVLSTAEQREDSCGNSFCDGHANQRDSDLLLPSPLESCPTAESDVSRSIFEGGLPPSPTHLPSSPFNSSSKDFVSDKEKCPPEDHSSRIDLSALSQRKSYLCRTVQIPPGKVGAVLYTSPLGPAVQSIKSTSSIYGQVEVGDLIVELDGVDTTERRAKEVTEMLINSADRERQIVVLKEKTFEDFEQDDEPSIGEDSIDRYLALDDDGDDEQALALASATVASGQTARAGNTRAHNKARNPAMDCSTRTAAKVELANSETAYVEAVSAKFTKSTKDNTCTSGISHRCCRSKHYTLESNEAANKYDSQKIKGSTAFSSTVSDESQRLPALGSILKTGSDVSSLSDSLQSSWFDSDRINGSNARRLSPIHEGSATYRVLSSEALVAELERRLALYKAASMERHHDTARIVRDDRLNSNASEHGFDLFLDGVGEGSSALSTDNAQYADIDFQSIACAVADEILKAVRVSGYVPG